VCSPYRASLVTGQFPLTHRVIVNDVNLSHNAVSLADAFTEQGYDTAYIGKWHLDGHGRASYIPPERRQGFDYWKVLECTHDYVTSNYYAGNSPEKLRWPGYDATAQTRDACTYINEHDREKPFLLVLSWGPPHDPFGTAPEAFANLYSPENLTFRPNVPEETRATAAEWLCGYYAHCSALDACMGELLETVRTAGIEDDTIFVFTSDHGDMVGSQGMKNKQRPWDESIRVPFLLRYPALLGREPVRKDALIDAPDLMPTLLGLCRLGIPDTVEGKDYSGYLQGDEEPGDGAALITCPHPFSQWRVDDGGCEYRGVRTRRHTYVRNLDGPWLLYDNQTDPFQMDNLVNKPEQADIQQKLETCLQSKLKQAGDEFLPGTEYMKRWDYPMDATGAVPYWK